MSIWGKVIGGVAGFALGGPLGAMMGAYAGHMMVDRNRVGGMNPAGGLFGAGGVRSGAFGAGASPFGAFGAGASPSGAFASRPQPAPAPSTADRQVAFTLAVIVLGAKMAKADGQVTPDEIRAFREVFAIPPEEAHEVGRLFDEARRDATGFEPYAAQIAEMFAGQPAVLEELLGGLFHIAKAHRGVGPTELAYLSRVASIFGFDRAAFERMRAVHAGPAEGDPYEVLGLTGAVDDATIKRTYHELIRKCHPDALTAQGMPQEFIDLANRKMALINAAYDRIAKERGLK